SGVLRKFKQLNAECNRLTESKLRRASFVISKLKNNPELKKTYDEHLKSSGPAETKFLSEKV
ncbi:MAG TPA: flagellar biosynthesis protein FlgN, partial [Ruminococcaceae bacterium]|nr:flagellar biosynthesis protein FlgN [Oscillospiraceae bacterium]